MKPREVTPLDYAPPAKKPEPRGFRWLTIAGIVQGLLIIGAIIGSELMGMLKNWRHR